jgi:hypothetical protein
MFLVGRFRESEKMTRWILVLAVLSIPAVAAAEDAPTRKGADLEAYRLKAATDTLCRQMGGKVSYATAKPQCEPPKVVSGGASQSRETVGRPAPLSARH